jgi:hypothetical protein
MTAAGMTLGDIKGFLEFAKAAGGSLIVDFDALFGQIRSLLQATGQMTPEIRANLDLAEAELKANPALFDIGKATFVASVDELLAKYPASTLLSDIPEFNGGSTPGPVPVAPGVSTVPSSVVFSFFNSSPPTAEKLASLAEFSKAQFEAYKAAGVARPELGPYEALGRSFAETIQFDTKYGKLGIAEFVTTAYRDVFERAASTVQADHFKGQISYFEALYKSVGMNTATATLLAKGAVTGQMLGFAALDEASKHPYIVNATKGLAMSASSAAFEAIEPQNYDFV